MIRVDVPPLRQRREDVPELLRHYFDVGALELGVAPKSLTEEAQLALVAIHWPVNVRQLVNACCRLTVVAAGGEITRADTPTYLGGGPAAAAASSDLSQVLAGWAQVRLLGWGRNTLTRKLKELGIDEP